MRVLRAPRHVFVSLLNIVYSAIWLTMRVGRKVISILRRLGRKVLRLLSPARGLCERIGIAAPRPPLALVERISASLKTHNPVEIENVSIAVLEEFVVPTVHKGMLMIAGRAGRRHLRQMSPDELADVLFQSCITGPPCFPPFPPETHSILAEAVRRYSGIA